MLKPVLTFLLGCIAICTVQSQKYLECTFDKGDLPCKLHPVGAAPALQTMCSVTLDDLSVDPIIPLSDVTSITEPTMGNNFTCALPYKLYGSSIEMYFCSRLSSSMGPASCLTEDATHHECTLGQYVMAQLAPRESLTYSIEVLGTRGVSCVSFYYYISRPDVGQVVARFSDTIGGMTKQLGTAFDVPYNGWHRADFSFQPNMSNYQIQFDLQRSELLDKLVFIALDEIKVLDGPCESDIIETTTNADQTSTQDTVTTATTPISAVFTTEETTVSSTQTLGTSTESSSISTQSPSPSTTRATTTVPLTSETSFDSTISSTPVSVTTVSSTTTSTTSSTVHPFRPRFRCDFTTSCFGKDGLRITDGIEFNPGHLSLDSEPPRAPTSDVTSVTTPTSNNQICSLPYRPKLDASTTTTPWDMWFCYNKKCPVPNGQTATCAPGSYGLISLNPSDAIKTIIDPLTPNVAPRDTSRDHCLRFYYYVTVYHEMDWGQHIQLWIRPNNQSDNRRTVGVLTVNEIRQNSWHFHEITFERGSSADTLQMDFVVLRPNRTGDPATNETVYFALDDMELYGYNCSYVRDQLPETTTTRPLPITTTEPQATPPPAQERKPQLGLILGLSLGIGIPVILLTAGGVLFYVRKRKRGTKLDFIEMDRSLYDQSNVGDSFSSSHTF